MNLINLSSLVLICNLKFYRQLILWLRGLCLKVLIVPITLISNLLLLLLRANYCSRRYYFNVIVVKTRSRSSSIANKDVNKTLSNDTAYFSIWFIFSGKRSCGLRVSRQCLRVPCWKTFCWQVTFIFINFLNKVGVSSVL